MFSYGPFYTGHFNKDFKLDCGSEILCNSGKERMRCGHKNAQSYALAFCLDPEITIKLHRGLKMTIATLQNHWRFAKALQNVHEDSSFFPLRVAHGNIAAEMSSVPSLCYCAHTMKRLLQRQNLLQRQKMCMSFSPGLLLLRTENIASARKRENILEC